LAHDLRNPLNAVTAAIQLLQRSSASDPAKRDELVNRAGRGLKRIDGMVRDLLDYARAGAGAIPIVRERMDLVELARDLIEEFETADPERRIDLTHEGDTTGEWDRSRLYQALSNLVGNATHYGHGRATVTMARTGDEVHVVVRNDGPPIAPDVLPTIFEPFRRGDTEGPGLGLGLYIVQAIARAHGGEVAVTSSPGSGTTFTMRLPVVPASM
jgi:signal transduction histidine kinase